MSINANIGDFTRTTSDFASNSLNSLQSALKNINGSVQTRLSTLWSGGFVGISLDGITVLQDALEKYIHRLEAIIEGFNPEGDISIALKGEPKEAAYMFIESIKSMLLAYISTLKGEIAEMKQAYDNFIVAGYNISNQVSQDAEQIRSSADQIRI